MQRANRVSIAERVPLGNRVAAAGNIDVVEVHAFALRLQRAPQGGEIRVELRQRNVRSNEPAKHGIDLPADKGQGTRSVSVKVIGARIRFRLREFRHGRLEIPGEQAARQGAEGGPNTRTAGDF